MSEKILEIKDERLSFFTPAGEVKALNGVSFSMNQGDVLGIVGESGSGKSVTAMSVAGLLPRKQCDFSGEILLDGAELLHADRTLLRQVQGREIGVVFQEPQSCMDPLMRIGPQVEEVLRIHTDLSREARRDQALAALAAVELPDPAGVYRKYPHELSGGMLQRAMIAAAVVARPKLLLLDEPTTALDVTIQAQILRLMGDLRRDHGTAILLITHNMGVVAQLCDYVYVMYAGQIVEAAETFALFRAPRHPYTQGLLKAIPSLEGTADRLYTIRGSVPDPRCPLPGCRFCPRCDQSRQDCARQVPDLRALAAGHWVRCCHIS